MRRVIVNSTPIIVLCNIGLLDILKALYAEICIPEAVYREVTEKDDSACQVLKTALNWIHVEKIANQSDKKMYKAKLHDGFCWDQRVPVVLSRVSARWRASLARSTSISLLLDASLSSARFFAAWARAISMVSASSARGATIFT